MQIIIHTPSEKRIIHGEYALLPIEEGNYYVCNRTGPCIGEIIPGEIRTNTGETIYTTSHGVFVVENNQCKVFL